MTELLPLRRLWMMYREFAAPVISGPYRRMLARSFYAGAESTLTALNKMLQDGDYADLHQTIRRHARRIEAFERLVLRERRH